jgi:hypothetical protein
MQENGANEPDESQAPLSVPHPEPVAYEAYADWYQFRNSANTIYLEFTLSQPDAAPKRVAAIRMSPIFAKKLAILFKWQIHRHEQDYRVDIPIEPDQLGVLGIDLERDWTFPDIAAPDAGTDPSPSV